MRAQLRARLRLFSLIIILFALFIAARLYFVQIVHGADFAHRAERQYENSTQALYDRGSIYFTRKDGTMLSAAGIATGFRLALDPKRLKDPEAAYAALSAHASIDRAAFDEAAAKTDDPYEVIAVRVPEAAGQAIAELKIPGVLVERERWRVYPAGQDAAQSIGFVAYDNDNDLAGRFGLERYYENVLSRGNEGLFGNFFAELFADVGDAVGDARQASEGDLVTTIEPVVQEKLGQVLAEVQGQYGSRETGGIIMNPRTGEIIALQVVPTFDPGDFSQADPATFGNPLVENQYEFGSIMKALTMAAGLDAGVVSANTTYNDTGCITLNTAKICNYDLEARGVVPMQEVLSQSLNVGASFVAGRLGHERFRGYFQKLGFGTETGIDLPSEAGGDIRNIESSPRDIEYATASYGQGIAETPVQMIKALSALANGGSTVTPHLVSAVRLESGVVKTLAWNQPERVFSPEAVEETTRMLVKVVDSKLADGSLSIPEVSVAAKTGTAQVPGPGGKYAPGLYLHSFFGYFPAYDPEFIILLYTREPGGVQYASETLTHPFMDLTHFLINYYAVAPDRASLEP
ncbi:MAG TPA: penicillin-binding protein 2 [Candidatus Paceibacterota bacterium]|nr:penicillin-binding protein 2 [Candidatus Paceibacterota bacterium]